MLCCGFIDGTAENVSSVAEAAEYKYEDDFEPEESEKSSLPNSDDGYYFTNLREKELMRHIKVKR